jgi:hypothetical protein
VRKKIPSEGKSKKPNFFIVGAQRSGTTALSEYLRSNPNICFSTPKEPHFFAEDFPYIRKAVTLEEYLNLFKDCKGDEIAVGEGSTAYLQSVTAISNIYKYNSNARIIVMLRNPVDMVYSLHAHLYYRGQEDENDFERAWRLQDMRRIGKKLPKDKSLHFALQYATVGKIGLQVKRLLNIFPFEQVKIIFFEDFIARPQVIYNQVLSFLNVPFDKRMEFPVVNPNIAHRSPVAVKLFRKLIPWKLRFWMREVMQNHPFPRLGIGGYIHKVSSSVTIRNPLSSRLRNELISEFRSDIEELSVTINKDLKHWLKSEEI